MNNSIAKLRDHLVPFLFETMEGSSASYEGQKVKMIRLLPASSLASYLYSAIEYDYKKGNKTEDRFFLYLSITKKNSFQFSGTIYIENKGVKNELILSSDKIRSINNLFEDIFRVSIVSYIDGCNAGGLEISKSCEKFIEKYNLDEYDFSANQIRKMYYEAKKKALLRRFQNRSVNNIIGFF